MEEDPARKVDAMNRGLPKQPPAAWYALGRSDALAAGEVRSVTFCGERAVLFRTEAGEAVLASAWCPHLGADLGAGGTVRGESLVCPFHGFAFDPSGRCVDTPTHAPPKRAVLATWPVVERGGMILAWFDPEGEAPDWDVPDWTAGRPPTWPARSACLRLRSHPQEVSENSVDLAHFSEVHGYYDLEQVRPLRTEGPHLHACYRMSRSSPFPGLGDTVRFESDIHVYGLGVSIVDVSVLTHGFRYWLAILPTPVEEGWIDLRVVMAAQEGLVDAPPALGWLPERLITRLVHEVSFRAAVHDVRQDQPIWEHKRHVHPPVLSREDGPIVPYRRWCRQFYPAAASA